MEGTQPYIYMYPFSLTTPPVQASAKLLLLKKKFIYLFLAVLSLSCCVGFSLVVENATLKLRCTGFSLQWLL